MHLLVGDFVNQDDAYGILRNVMQDKKEYVQQYTDAPACTFIASYVGVGCFKKLNMFIILSQFIITIKNRVAYHMYLHILNKSIYVTAYICHLYCD